MLNFFYQKGGLYSSLIMLLALSLTACMELASSDSTTFNMNNRVDNVSYRPDGKMLAVSVGNSVKVYSMPSMILFHSFDHSEAIYRPRYSWSLDNQSIAIWEKSNDVQIWQLSNLTLAQTISSELVISHVALEDARIAIGVGFDTENNTFIWNVGQQNPAKKINTEKNKNANVSSDHTLLAVGGYDDSITILELATAKILTKRSGL